MMEVDPCGLFVLGLRCVCARARVCNISQEHVNEIVSMTYQYLNMIKEEGIQVRIR